MHPFEQFVLARRKDFKRIASRTNGEHDWEDVAHDAWEVALDLAKRESIAIDFLDHAFQERLLSYLFNRMVHYDDRKIRFAVRLDHGNDEDDGPNPLMLKLAGQTEDEPLAQLLVAEAASAAPVFHARYSQAEAWLLLLQNHDNRMRSVARHLLISTSQAYKRCRRVQHQIGWQESLTLPVAADSFRATPWRRYRYERKPKQFVFDFCEKLPLA